MQLDNVKTLRDAVNYGKQFLEDFGIENAQYDATELLLLVMGISRTQYLINSMDKIDSGKLAEYAELINKRAEHIPLQHITGIVNFYGREYKVNANVLIPRQDTEILVEEVMKLTNSESRVLDMCTGSGCIIISLAASGHTSENGAVAIDISDDALKVADYNKKYNNADYIKLIKSDMFSSSECEQYKNEDNRFDVIVSNPPYIPTKDIDELSEEVRLHDPVLALDGDTDGLKFYKAITTQSVNYLKENGYLCYEIGYNQAEDVRNIMEQCGYSGIKVIKDLAGLDRVVIGRLNNIN